MKGFLVVKGVNMVLLRILAFVFLIPGILTVFGARSIVSRFKLDDNVQCDFEHEMSEEELARYKHNKATVNLKMAGMLIALPGFILFLIAFK